MRIVSLIPSATEIVQVLGKTSDQVGRSHECDYPPEVTQLPVLTEAKLKTNVPSLQIDQQVKHILQNALAVYRVFTDKLQQLKPDVILTQSQCEVCAVSLKDVEAAVCSFVGSKPKIVSLEPMALKDVWSDIRKVAQALQVEDKGEAVVKQLQGRMEAIEKTAKALPHKPKVALVEWIDPLMAGGNWMPELVEQAGGQNLFSQAGVHSPYITMNDLTQADPDVIVVLPCGFDLERNREEMKVLDKHPQWQQLRAVKSGQVFLTDGNQFFNRPGPRLVESLEMLAEILHPEVFQFGHHGKAWEKHQPNKLQTV